MGQKKLHFFKTKYRLHGVANGMVERAVTIILIFSIGLKILSPVWQEIGFFLYLVTWHLLFINLLLGDFFPLTFKILINYWNLLASLLINEK